MGQLSVGGVSAQFRPVLALLTESGTYTVPYAGWYRIAAVGHGGNGAYAHYGTSLDYLSPGGAGGMGYVDKYLSAGAVLTVTITNDVTTVTLGGTDLISATAGSSAITGTTDTKCRAGTVTGDGVVAAPSNGTETADITPPDAYNSPIYKSSGGYSGAVKGTGNIELGEKDGGDGLFGADGPDGGMCFYNANSYVGVEPARTPERGAGAADAGGAPHYNGSTYTYGGAGGGAGYGGGGGAIEGYRSYSSDYYALGNGGQGGAGCVRIERIR